MCSASQRGACGFAILRATETRRCAIILLLPGWLLVWSPRGPLWCRSWLEVCDNALVARVHVVKGHVAQSAKRCTTFRPRIGGRAAPVRAPVHGAPCQRTPAFAEASASPVGIVPTSEIAEKGAGQEDFDYHYRPRTGSRLLQHPKLRPRLCRERPTASQAEAQLLVTNGVAGTWVINGYGIAPAERASFTSRPAGKTCYYVPDGTALRLTEAVASAKVKPQSVKPRKCPLRQRQFRKTQFESGLQASLGTGG